MIADQHSPAYGPRGQKGQPHVYGLLQRPRDKQHKPMSLNTGELFNRLVYAPVYNDELLPAVKSWIDLNKKNAPDCSIQCRVPGTSKILYA